MKIINLNQQFNVYTSNAYLVLGSWNTLKDMNTLVDAGRDPAIIELLEQTPSGVGKCKLDAVVLTHSHYDHVTNLKELRIRYKPKVYAYSRYMDDVDQLVEDNNLLTLGDKEFRVVHTPGHTNDSICLFCQEEGVLFSGDTAIKLDVKENGEKKVTAGDVPLSRVKIIYPGHGNPIIV